MILSDFESRDARGHFFQTDIPFYVDNYQIRQYNTCGAYFYGSATPLPQGVGAPALTSFGVPFCLGLYIQPLTQKFDVATGDCMHSYMVCFVHRVHRRHERESRCWHAYAGPPL